MICLVLLFIFSTHPGHVVYPLLPRGPWMSICIVLLWYLCHNWINSYVFINFFLQMRVLFAGLVAWTLLSTVYTRMADSDAAKFYECYKNREINFNISIATINEVMSDPCQQYATEATFDLLTNYNISMDDVNWLRSLDREARGVLGYKVKRWKRQAVRLRQRRDCRALSPRERRRLFRAIRLLKFRSVRL